MGRKTPIFSGDVRQCLSHYASTLPTGKSQVLAARKPLVDFCGISTERAYRWLQGKKLPTGENLIRLKYFLYGKGYEVSELQSLIPQVLSLGWVISVGKISFDEVCRLLGYSGRDSFFPVLNGVSNPSKVKIDKIEAILRQFPDEISSSPESQFFSSEKQAKYLGLKNGARDAVFRALTSQVEAMLPLAEAVLSEDFSDEERRQLRRSIPDDGLYRAAQALHGLCSKKSRNLTLDKKRGE